MERLLSLLIPASGDPCFGLNSARFVDSASFSVLGYISMNCSTLRDISAQIPIYEKIVGDMGVSSLDITDGHLLQRWQCQFENEMVRRHAVENVLASWYTFMCKFLHFDAMSFDSIWFEHAAPEDPAMLDNYTKIFGCKVLFDQAASGLFAREEVFDLPIPQADEKLLRTLLDHATQILANIDLNQSITDQVKNLLRLMLKDQFPSSALIAEKLKMSSRTLQRKLNDEGTSYKDVLNDLRLELALHYLKNTGLSLEDIACKLGYAEARSFYRSFKQWTGRTAGSYRTSLP
ncbi:MAG: AraC-like DNA-binding protein [Glaciecola sp.]|jgi:AraC-like DNA-binding protein